MDHIEGCGTSAITGLAYSEAAQAITPEELAAAGGSVSDNCTVASVTYQDSQAGSCPLVVTRVFTATDLCGNPTVRNQTIEIDDTTAPTLAAPANKTGVDHIEGCGTSAITGLAYSEAAQAITEELAAAGGSVSDNCTVASVTYQDSQAGSCPLVVTRVFTATDLCGNPTVRDQTIEIDDTTAPTLAAPADGEDRGGSRGCGTSAITGLAYSEAAQAIAPEELAAAGGSVSDNCTVASVTYQDSQAGSCPLVVTRVFTATDLCGNPTVRNQTIEIDDTTAPTLAAPANKTGVDHIEGCGTSAITGLAYSEAAQAITPEELAAAGGSVSDNCTVASVARSDSQAGVPAGGDAGLHGDGPVREPDGPQPDDRDRRHHGTDAGGAGQQDRGGSHRGVRARSRAWPIRRRRKQSRRGAGGGGRERE